MKTIEDLGDLLMHHIRNLYVAEEQSMRVMPGIIDRAHHSSLKNALSHHAGLTADQKKRLEKVATLVSDKMGDASEKLSSENSSPGMSGLIEEVNQLLSADLSKDVTDAVIIAGVQKMEHYEITTYGTALAYARQLHLHKVEALLTETLHEEYDADDLLTAIATAAINKEALREGVQQGMEDTNLSEGNEETGPISRPAKVSISERSVNSPGGRAGTSHRGNGSGESRGH